MQKSEVKDFKSAINYSLKDGGDIMIRHSFLRRKFSLIGLILLVAIVLVACGGKDMSQKDTNTNREKWDGQSIKVMLIGFDKESKTDPISGEKVEGVNVLKEEFEKRYPGAKVEFILMPWKGYTEKTQAMLTSNEADVYQMPGVADFSSQGVLEPLQPYIDKENFDLEIFFNNQVEGWKAFGPEDEEPQIFGMPFHGGSRVNAYDKKIFDDWGVEYLSDYPTAEEISEKSEKMTGINPVTGEHNYGIWFRGDWDSAFKVVNYAEGKNGSWGEGFAWDEVELNFNSPKMVEGLNWLLEMQKFAPDGIVSDQGNEKWLSEDNDIAIMLDQAPAELIQKVYNQGFENRIGIVQQFKNNDGIGGMFGGSPLTMAKNSKNKELAWEWIRFATSDFAQEYVFDTKKSAPVIKSATEWESMQEMELMQPVLESMGTMTVPKYPWGSAQPRYILTSEIEAALSGKRTAKEALDKAQKESTEWVENR